MSSRTIRACRWLSLAVLLTACASDAAKPSAPENGAETEPTQPEEQGTPTLNGCKPEDYVDASDDDAERAIAIAAAGLTYTPRCMTIRVGQTVHWMGSLTAHPLAPGNPDDAAAGSADNPIEETSTGSSVAFEFGTRGTFPYYCVLHAFGAGQGMAGSIRVR